MIHLIDLHFLENDTTIAAFLVETSEGPVLVESGPHSTFKTLEAGIAKAGYAVTDIKHVFVTHIHFDHAGAAWAFAEHGAKVYVHPFGAGHLSSPSKLTESARRIYLDQMDVLWGEMRDIPLAQIVAPEDQTTITIGNRRFKAWYTPGHAYHHIAWQLEDVVFTGDVAGVKIGADGMVIPPCPPPDIHLEKWQQSIQTLRNLAPSQLYLTHYGVHQNYKEHLDELEHHLVDYAQFVKVRWEKEIPQNEIVTEFNHYVNQQLREAGYTERRLAQYQAANPAFMSVAGLIRYWKKRTEGSH
ncbi:MBL fold metallo-hydrolase [Eisenibacter elegans]|jgi:glyoxylase-like metal-dependent hydrolase (beta-lactamase superfamily II)|uniref:MBL fold metallo-hydrolase n=1 Tax=Eisenibacter elegans TaxID=997 RepID=UPI0004016841|nr:MBL fold metallo-hydrolase [Eisenibacter elegans]